MSGGRAGRSAAQSQPHFTCIIYIATVKVTHPGQSGQRQATRQGERGATLLPRMRGDRDGKVNEYIPGKRLIFLAGLKYTLIMFSSLRSGA